jgi:hypothetical protein
VVFALEAFFGREPSRSKALGAPYHRTLWLGSIKAVVLGASEPPPKNRQAATIRMSKARTAIRSICLGSWPLRLIFQRIVSQQGVKPIRRRRRGSRHGSNARFIECGVADASGLIPKKWIPVFEYDHARTNSRVRFEPYGALTPRHRPNRHGRYHRAPGGRVSGTLSIPEVPQGWQRNSRAKVIQPPAHSPKRSIASSP